MDDKYRKTMRAIIPSRSGVLSQKFRNDGADERRALGKAGGRGGA